MIGAYIESCGTPYVTSLSRRSTFLLILFSFPSTELRQVMKLTDVISSSHFTGVVPAETFPRGGSRVAKMQGLPAETRWPPDVRTE